MLHFMPKMYLIVEFFYLVNQTASLWSHCICRTPVRFNTGCSFFTKKNEVTKPARFLSLTFTGIGISLFFLIFFAYPWLTVIAIIGIRKPTVSTDINSLIHWSIHCIDCIIDRFALDVWKSSKLQNLLDFSPSLSPGFVFLYTSWIFCLPLASVGS